MTLHQVKQVLLHITIGTILLAVLSVSLATGHVQAEHSHNPYPTSSNESEPVKGSAWNLRCFNIVWELFLPTLFKQSLPLVPFMRNLHLLETAWSSSSDCSESLEECRFYFFRNLLWYTVMEWHHKEWHHVTDEEYEYKKACLFYE